MAIDFMNLFAPRGTPTGLDALLTEDQRRLMGRNANLSAAAALLQASGPSRQRVGLGQALGAALQAGQQGFQQARTGSLQELMLGEKLRAGQDERNRDTNFFAMLRDAGQPAAAMPAPAMPAPAMPAPQQGVQVFPFDAPIANPSPQPSMAGQLQQQAIAQAAAPAPMAQAATAPSTNIFTNLTPNMRSLLGQMSRKDATQFLLNQAQAAEEFGAPTAVMMNGRPVMVQYNKQGKARIAQGAMPYEPQSQDIRAVEYITNTPLAGTGDTGIAQVGQYREQIAPKTKVSVGKGGLDLTPLQEARDKDFAKIMNEWVSGGGADMIGNVAQIGTVLQRLESGQQLTGPMIGIMPDLFLAITNPNAAGAKEQVQEVVQRNLRIVLGAQFTEKEGNQLISRAYNPTLLPAQNAARLRKLFQQMSVAAQQRQAMVDYATENGTLKGYRGPQPNINDFYKALEVRPIGLTDIEAELKRREAQR